MGQGPVAPSWSPLSVSELKALIPAFPQLGDVLGVEWHSPRPFAASGLVSFDAGRFFVKRHAASVRSLGDLQEEHAFIGHLRRRGAPVPEVLASTTGATAVAGLAGTYEIHALGSGDDSYRDAPSWTPMRTVADAWSAGAALARLHAAAGGYAAPPRRTRLLVAADIITRSRCPFSALEDWVATDERLAGALQGRAWRDDFTAVLLPWIDALRPHCAVLAPLWAHGDFHASNLLWHNGAVAEVLDFGLSNRTSAAFDLATAIERNAISWLRLGQDYRDIGHGDLAGAVVEGYCSVAGEPRWLPALRRLLPVVHVEFALSELAYFHAITRSRSDADRAYHDFLLGHAAWFSSAEGARLLDRLP